MPVILTLKMFHKPESAMLKMSATYPGGRHQFIATRGNTPSGWDFFSRELLQVPLILTTHSPSKPIAPWKSRTTGQWLLSYRAG
jgi:hypothetical protein